ncbi:dual specificity protein phosphatase [Microbacterium sp.]|uniref:dual specificity protein phosphatase family protein n=1 Tax=Microbacterium sp. TaxID=51671 RepID=UPI0025F5BD4A|nr:dual specificity protein phosphatase [Microbacterium sp.]MBT9605459.1 dual specificity protein phosphatase family protein [Microbacterium sp.]
MNLRLQWANAHQLTDHLWVGGELDQADRERAHLQLNELTAASGIDTIIDCRFEANDMDWVTEAAPQLEYLHLGVEDAGYWMPDDWFDEGTEFALDQVGRGHTVLAHCQAGINRGPSMAFAVLIAQGWDAIEALDHIRAVRPIAQIGYAEDAILWTVLKAGGSAAEAKEQMNRVRRWRSSAGLPRRSQGRYDEPR